MLAGKKYQSGCRPQSEGLS